MVSLTTPIFTGAQVRQLDRHAIERAGIPSYTLMSRAGAAALAVLRQRWPEARRIAVACGPGNNGGDGLVLARLARAASCDVTVTSTAEPAHLSGDARRAYDEFIQTGGALERWSDSVLQADVIVDALFGIGLSREISGAAAEQIAAINASHRPVLALDIPSGLHADSGLVMGVAVNAHCTVSFLGLKLGFFVGQGPEHTGEIVRESLDAPLDPQVRPCAQVIEPALTRGALPPRARTAHKGAYGRLLIIGGGPGMPGAVRLAGEAALRVGAGLVTVATHPDHVAAIVGPRPELICHAAADAGNLETLLERADVIAVGPGLGQHAWSRAVMDAAFACDKPLVADADALNLLAQAPRVRRRWVLTPHPGEAGRLLGCSASDVQRNRFETVRTLAQRFSAIVVLKGACTLVCDDGGEVFICDRGNPGMASAGMGDVLTGVIAGLAAPTGDLSLAAKLGVLVHASAGDLAAQGGERGLIASDLLERLRVCVNPFST